MIQNAAVDDEDEDVDNEEDLASVEHLRRPQKHEYVDLEDQYDDEEDEDQIFTSEIDNADEMIWLSDTKYGHVPASGIRNSRYYVHNPQSLLSAKSDSNGSSAEGAKT